MEVTQDPALVAWLCERADGFFVANPDHRKPASHATLLNQTQQLVKNFSDLLEDITKSIADGVVDAEEARRIRGEWETLKRHAEGFVRACEHKPSKL